MEDQSPSSFEQMPEASPARSSAKTRRVKSESRKAPRKTALSEARNPRTLSPFLFGVLLLGLALSVFNLWLMTARVSRLNGLEESFQTLLGNYGTRSPEKKDEPAPPLLPQEESVTLLYSVTDGESILPGLQEKLADPIVDYYKAVGKDLDAVLVERKQPLSKVVRVRLFFADRTESEFLWPFTGKDDDWWVPSCTVKVTEPDLPACPAEFLAKYPEIRRLMEKKRT